MPNPRRVGLACVARGAGAQADPHGGRAPTPIVRERVLPPVHSARSEHHRISVNTMSDLLFVLIASAVGAVVFGLIALCFVRRVRKQEHPRTAP